MFSKCTSAFYRSGNIAPNAPVGEENSFRSSYLLSYLQLSFKRICTLSEAVTGSKKMLYKNRSSSKSCVKLPPRNMVNIVFSAFLHCEFCGRYSSKFVFKVSNSYLRENLFVALQSYVFFPLLIFYVFFVSFVVLFFSIFHFSIANVNVKKRYSSIRLNDSFGMFRNFMIDRKCPCIFSFDRVLQNTFF